MPAQREDDVSRRSVVPDRARRSLWLAAAWTGAGAAVVCATLAVVAVAAVWMPASGASGHATSTVHAGLLTYLAALHGGVTVDGTPAQFVPLGMTLLVALVAWRAGAGLADAAQDSDERDAVRLLVAGGVQAFSFMVVSLVFVPFAQVGTSTAPFVGVGLAALLLFSVSGGAAFLRWSALGPLVARWLPSFSTAVLRSATAALTVYVGCGALLVAGSLGWHHARAEELSRSVGGGWSGVPILLLGLLALPNAVVAGASYLAGPGFTVGSGAGANAWSASHGVLPAFPPLAAMPSGRSLGGYGWIAVLVVSLAAGAAVGRLACRAQGWRARFRDAALASVVAGLAMAVLAWQGGGGIGSGRLAVVGASPWQLALAVAGVLAVTASAALGAVWSVQWWTARRPHGRTMIDVALPEFDTEFGTALDTALDTEADPADQPTVRLVSLVDGSEAGTENGTPDGTDEQAVTAQASGDGAGELAG